MLAQSMLFGGVETLLSGSIWCLIRVTLLCRFKRRLLFVFNHLNIPVLLYDLGSVCTVSLFQLLFGDIGFSGCVSDEVNQVLDVFSDEANLLQHSNIIAVFAVFRDTQVLLLFSFNTSWLRCAEAAFHATVLFCWHGTCCLLVCPFFCSYLYSFLCLVVASFGLFLGDFSFLLCT